jgi:hypothetical protein
MIKAVMKRPDGRTMLAIGLSFDNLDRFRAEPGDTFIHIDGNATDGLPIDIVIFSGQTEADLAQFFADNDMIRSDTKVYVDPKLKS